MELEAKGQGGGDEEYVEAELRLKLDFKTLGPEGSKERADFTRRFAEDLAAELGIDPSQIDVLQLLPGLEAR